MNVSFENVVEVEDTSCTLVNILSTHLFLRCKILYLPNPLFPIPDAVYPYSRLVCGQMRRLNVYTMLHTIPAFVNAPQISGKYEAKFRE